MIKLVYLCCFAFFAQSFALQLSSTYSVDWKVVGDRINFDIVANAIGWIGLGFNSVGGMPGADIVVAGIKEGQKYIYDMHADGFEQPIQDKISNYELLRAAENATHTVLTISRALDTKDKPNDYVIAGDPLYLLYAYHKFADIIDPSQFPKHTFKGSKQLTLLNAVKVH